MVKFDDKKMVITTNLDKSDYSVLLKALCHVMGNIDDGIISADERSLMMELIKSMLPDPEQLK